MCSDRNAVKAAIVLGHHVVLTLRYAAPDTIVFLLAIHFRIAP